MLLSKRISTHLTTIRLAKTLHNSFEKCTKPRKFYIDKVHIIILDNRDNYWLWRHSAENLDGQNCGILFLCLCHLLLCFTCGIQLDRYIYIITDIQTPTYRYRPTDTKLQTYRHRYTDIQTKTYRHRHTDKYI